MRFKKAVLYASLYAAVFLACCTAASFKIYHLMLPEVIVQKCSASVPVQSITLDKMGASVLCVIEREGLWGKEYQTMRYSVEVKEYKGEKAVLEEGMPYNRQQVVLYSSRAIDEEEVKVIGK